MDRNAEMFEACFAALRAGPARRRSIRRARRTPRRGCSGSRRARRASRSATRQSARAPSPSSPSASPSRRASRSGRACSFPSVRLSPCGPISPRYRDDPAKAVDALTDGDPVGDGGRGRPRRRASTRTALVGLSSSSTATTSRARSWRARGLARRDVDPRRLARSIVDAVDHFKARDPERVERLWQRIQAYRALLAEYTCATRRCGPGSSAPSCPAAAASVRRGAPRAAVLRVRRPRQRPALLHPARARPPHRPQGDRLRNDALSGQHPRLSRLLGARDLAGGATRRPGLGAPLRADACP